MHLARGGGSVRSALDFELYFLPVAGRVYRKPRAAGSRVVVGVGVARAGPLSFDTSEAQRVYRFVCSVIDFPEEAQAQRV